jgi:demethylmenaquinone methyltransferase/2-methoxy-6-polyprenyl-1,4-benzoquinol methylase
VPLDDIFASPDSKQRYVRRLFSTIADRYDLITILLSFGLDRRWKRRVVALATPHSGTRALDLACGTGDLTLAVAGRGAKVVGLDVVLRMIQLARVKSPETDSGPVWFLVGDMGAVPFAAGEFDLVTTGYGLRNVPDLATAVREIHRVLRPGGLLVSLDFNRPDHPAVRAIYLAYLTAVGGALGWALHGDPDTYRYIPASIRRYPGAERVTSLLTAEGFTSARWLPVLGGLLSIHVARK